MPFPPGSDDIARGGHGSASHARRHADGGGRSAHGGDEAQPKVRGGNEFRDERVLKTIAPARSLALLALLLQVPAFFLVIPGLHAICQQEHRDEEHDQLHCVGTVYLRKAMWLG